MSQTPLAARSPMSCPQLRLATTPGGSRAGDGCFRPVLVEVHSSEFLVRRARVWVSARINDFLDGVAQVEFSQGGAQARYAFLRGWFHPAFRVTAGQFKRSFDLFELTSSSQILPVERTGRIRGVDDCAGVGSVCSYSRFSEALEFSSLDIGIMVEGDLSDGRISYRAGLTNGTGDNEREENGAKSFSARLQFEPGGSVALGANLSTHDYINRVLGTDAHALALALDAQVGDPSRGPRVKAAFMSGDNWRTLAPDGAERSFLAWQAVGAYRIPIRDSRYAEGVEAILRVSHGDPNREADSDGGWILTPGVSAYIADRNKVSANVDFWRPETGTSAWSIKVQTNLYF